MEMRSLLLDRNLYIIDIDEISEDIDLFESLTVDFNSKGMYIKSGLFTF